MRKASPTINTRNLHASPRRARVQGRFASFHFRSLYKKEKSLLNDVQDQIAFDFVFTPVNCGMADILRLLLVVVYPAGSSGSFRIYWPFANVLKTHIQCHNCHELCFMQSFPYRAENSIHFPLDIDPRYELMT